MRPSQGMLSFALMSNTSPTCSPPAPPPPPRGGIHLGCEGRQKQCCVCRPLGLNAAFMRPGWHGSDWVGWWGPSWKKKHNWCLLLLPPRLWWICTKATVVFNKSEKQKEINKRRPLFCQQTATEPSTQTVCASPEFPSNLTPGGHVTAPSVLLIQSWCFVCSSFFRSRFEKLQRRNWRFTSDGVRRTAGALLES